MSENQADPMARWADNPYAAALGDRETMRALADTPERLRAIADAMTPAQFARSYAPGKWTAEQLFLHLAQTELAFSTRVRMAITCPGYIVQPFDQDDWLRREPASGGLEAARAYYALRQFNLPLYRSLTPAERAQTLHHPERGEMRVEWILESLAGHELHHLAHFEIIAGR